MPLGFQLLPWDSSLFGFPVARVSANTFDSERLPNVLEALRSAGVRLAYASTPWSDTVATKALGMAGARCVDRSVRYRKEGLSRRPMPSGIESVLGKPCTPHLERLALSSGARSRFRADPGIPAEIFEKLYRAWIRRSMAGEIAGEVLVIRAGGAVSGMVTVAGSDSAPTGVIGLIAVDETHRGKGYGKQLVLGAEAWCAGRGLQALEVVTQARNAAACSLYDACGYGIVHDDAVFHLWLETV